MPTDPLAIEPEPSPLDAYHTTTSAGDERVIVVCPDGETSPLHPDDAETWAHEILRAVNRARDVANGDLAQPEARGLTADNAQEIRADAIAIEGMAHSLGAHATRLTTIARSGRYSESPANRRMAVSSVASANDLIVRLRHATRALPDPPSAPQEQNDPA